MWRMIPQWLIEKKRDGIALSDEEIRAFIEGFTDGTIPDYQMAAMAMAIYFKGMTPNEISVLTDIMMNSGDIVDTSGIDRPKVDKHSTGGIGDKVSLILAPLVACCDLAVPMISGRGLGITGGTLDKLDAIPGYRTDLSEKEFLSIVDTCGCSITGQTGQLAPADKKLYALRDVTGTVPSIPLITASIMSKKLAAGIDALVLDVKWGRGAFMKTSEDANKLAQSMVRVGANMGKSMAALITDMNQPLGNTVGNALEVKETIEALQGRGVDDLMEVTMALAARMLTITERSATKVEALGVLQQHLSSGRAFEKFKEMAALQGADVRALDNPDLLPTAPVQIPFPSPEAGYISSVNADLIGRASLVLGAGRMKTDDSVDLAVGLSDLVKAGTAVEKGDPLLILHITNEDKTDEARAFLADAFSFSSTPEIPPPMITDSIMSTRN